MRKLPSRFASITLRYGSPPTGTIMTSSVLAFPISTSLDPGPPFAGLAMRAMTGFRLGARGKAETGRRRVPRSGSFSRLAAGWARVEDAQPRLAVGPNPMGSTGMSENACSLSMVRDSWTCRLGLASKLTDGPARNEVTRMGVERRHRGDYSENDYFRMGAAIAVGELYDMALFRNLLEDDRAVRSYLESFGVRGMADVDDLGIKGPYRRDFERIFLGAPVD